MDACDAGSSSAAPIMSQRLAFWRMVEACRAPVDLTPVFL